MFTASYPALYPLASGQNDSPAPPIAAGDLLSDHHVIQATTQHKQRKRLYELDLATPEEAVHSKIRKTLVVAESSLHHHQQQQQQKVGIPAWAVALQNSLDALTKTFHDPDTGLHALANNVNALATALNQPKTGENLLALSVHFFGKRISALEERIDDPIECDSYRNGSNQKAQCLFGQLMGYPHSG